MNAGRAEKLRPRKSLNCKLPTPISVVELKKPLPGELKEVSKVAAVDTQSGRTAELMRLTYPAKWRSKAAAERFARDNHLDAAGVAVVEVAGAWRIVIDSHRVPMLTPWLRDRYPGVLWGVSWTPKQ